MTRFLEVFEKNDRSSIQANARLDRGIEAAELDKEALDLYQALREKGVCFEVCAIIAMRVLKVDPAGMIPEVKLVTNVFYSYIGYKTKGYAMIAIN